MSADDHYDLYANPANKPQRDTTRIAGMTLDGPRAALVVLVRDGERWRVESVDAFPIEAADSGPVPEYCGLPIILDAAAWTQDRIRHSAAVFRAAGWDVRPPMWLNGKAVNCSRADLTTAFYEAGIYGEHDDPEDRDVRFARDLAAWGATHETSEDPPIIGDNAGRDRPYTIDELKRLRVWLEDAESLTIGNHAAARLLATLDAAARERDEAERLLLEVAAHRSPCCTVEETGGCPVENGRRHLVARGLLPREGA